MEAPKEAASNWGAMTWRAGRLEGREARRDREVAALLAARAFVEIRHVAGNVRRAPEDWSPEDDLERVRFLADLCHNLPGIARPPVWKPSRRGAPAGSIRQAMTKRPMGWTWHTTGPEGRAWMLRHIEQAGRSWTPPPPLPARRKGPSPMTLRQRAGVLLGRWPVRPPDGRQALPAEAHVLKALDADAICALYEEAGRLRLGLGTGGPWLRAHLDTDSVHYLVPDPANYYWPGTPSGRGGEIRWWQCTALLRMRDGEQVTGMLAVLPETFEALPSTLPRREQVRLVHRARAAERDTYLWGRDHKAECDPQTCGFVPETTGSPPPDD
ncbi:hypothetical protein [Actinomadura sp. 7K507]|uniref:hypothetical protein n=1 Tax=Actinomadura sp. 7K507 TaxID=2530365 RepID=UPI001047A0AC|nr:hypothetical protein [Actinomadura sp. 7K507]TDC76618.1 hypothetical protein E1285_39805 [Actinomadura sp. 7K507]